ncbi:MAG: nitrite reductase large subunit NirB [Candidatus Nitricoxidivorans perseverans]|uniref:Nitrite reductase large subunit NirB n=1 Tax=Candidatus Nitricoxidivorans perseverans TaxID=2975601 RepID=A0AA49FJ43_9PROT|nr:MAG: nitrite reductase large subunit NirB [Candidatus Nitricoxidivorans perseverans]
MKEKLVVVGNGMAGVRVIEELLAIAPDKYDTTVIGAEPHGNYNRILLSQVLSGEKDFADTVLNDTDWYGQRGITLLAGKKVVAVNRARRCVVTSDGNILPYGRLVLATGAKPLLPTLPGTHLKGVVTFRAISDVEAMLQRARKGSRAVVIGGGLLGLEAAYGLKQRGMDVTVVHLMDRLLERQLDAPAAALLKQSLEARGLTVMLKAETQAIFGNGGVEGVRLRDGTDLPADLVVLAAGIQPNADLAREAGIHVERGIVVNETMQTYDPRVYAVGECVEHKGTLYGLVAPLFRQAKVCANQLAGVGFARYQDTVSATKLKITGIDLYSAGNITGGAGLEEMVMQDPCRGVYKKLVIRDNRLAGALLYGDTTDEARYYDLMRDGTDISGLRASLFQGHGGETGHGGELAVAAMPDDTEVCGCNGVTKGMIVKAVTENGLFTLDEVRAHTKASASCGSCAGKVEQILAFTLGGSYSPAPQEKPLCGCTDFTHDQVRRAIRENHLTTIPDAMRFLEWKTPDGCPKCRPALNYYLISTWPGEAMDDPQARVHNERVHANIQQDGTYAVVPRTWGGLTNAKELRAIADVADRMGVPVKVTGGQRLAIPFVKKEDLPKVWAELGQAGLSSGYAYGKAVRSVKSCVGKGLCRFGTQDSLGLGIRIEKEFWGAWTPHKFKMGVSGCPRNCAEATIKDLGLVGVDSGWEVHVGGTCGVRVRATDLLCKVATDDEAVEYAAAFLHLYREEGHYMERSSAWIERVGLPYARKRVVEDAEGRKQLAARFFAAQKHAQTDPWVERAANPAAWATEYQPLETTLA